MKTLSNKRPRTISLNNVAVLEWSSGQKEICVIIKYLKKREFTNGVYTFINSQGQIKETSPHWVYPKIIKIF
jgi:hypothetical protein